MTLLRLFGLLLLMLGSGCEPETIYGVSVGGYQSDGVDRPTAALLNNAGDVVVGALVGGEDTPEGVFLGYPALFRFRQRADASDLEAHVHLWDGADSVGVIGILESDQGMVVARNASHGMDVTCGDVWDGEEELILRSGRPGFVFAVPGGLVTVSQGQTSSEVVVSQHPYWEGHGCDVLVGSTGRFGDIGALMLADQSGSDVYVMGRVGQQLMLSRIRSRDGWRRWSIPLDGYPSAAMDAQSDGVLVALSRNGDANPPVVMFINDSGATQWSEQIPAAGDATIGAITRLPHGEIAISLVSEQKERGNRTRAEIVILGPIGGIRRRLPVQEPWSTRTHIHHLLVRPNGKLIAVLSVDPGTSKSRRPGDPYIEILEL